jgi:hypothetical protein
MPKNKVSDPITDQEMAFGRLVLSGVMTDRQAAETAGLNPDSAAYIKSKPSVRAYMLEHRAAVQQQLVQQEADLSRQAVGRAGEALHRFTLDREQVLGRLWELANLSPEMTRGSITAQVKAMSMIVALLNLIPDGRTVSLEKKFPAPSAPPGHGAQLENSLGVSGPDPAPGPAEEPPPDHGPSHSTVDNRVSQSGPPPMPLYIPLFASIPDLGVPIPIKKPPLNPFVYPR